MMLAERAVKWADSTADVERLNSGLAHDLF